MKKKNQEVQELQQEIQFLQEKLTKANSAFLNVVGNSLDGIVIVDNSKQLLYANRTAIAFFDKNLGELLGEKLELDVEFPCQEGAPEQSVELVISRPYTENIITDAIILPIEWNGKGCFAISLRDITERKKTEELLQYMSSHDFLTDLPNRVYFERKIYHALSMAKELSKSMAVLYLDLDNFKFVNDTLGHQVGDALLQQISKILTKSLRRSDTIARLGGDEFAIILTELQSPEDASIVASNLVEELSKPLTVLSHEVFVSVSIGIAVYPYAGDNPVDLIKNADKAMYNAKEHGKNQYRYFTEELNTQHQTRFQISSGLRHAIDRSEFFLEYQPIMDLQAGGCVGVEALVRWAHPNLGLLYPDEFIKDAEKLGNIVDVGHWVMNQAIDDYIKDFPNCLLYISINLSVMELSNDKLTNLLLTKAKDHRLNLERVILELTETTIMEHPDNTLELFHALKDIGVQVAIDDYGTGYSSLSYLKHLPVSILKIDRSFVCDIEKQGNDIIIESTIELAHKLGYKVVAEGVETEAQAELFKAKGCDYAQGFYFAKPMRLKKLLHFLKA